MNRKLALIAIAALALAVGCNAPSSMDKFKDAEAKRESRIRESDELERLKTENQKLKNSALKAMQTNGRGSRQVESQPAIQRTNPNMVGYLEHNQPYTEQRLKQMALELAVSFAINEQRRLTEEVADPGYEMTEGLRGTRNSDYSKYKYNRDRMKTVTRIDNGKASIADVSLNLNDKDRLLWAEVEVHFGTARNPYSLFYYFSQGKNSEGGFFWSPYNTKGMTK